MTGLHITSEPSLDAAVGRRVHELLWDRKLRQRDLCAVLGMQEAGVSKKLRGSRAWTLDELRATAAFLGTTIAYLTGEVGDPGLVHPLGLEPRTHWEWDDRPSREPIPLEHAFVIRESRRLLESVPA